MCASLAMTKKGFWQTMDLLVGSDWRRTRKEVTDDVEDWVEKVIRRREKLGNSVDEEEDNLSGLRSKNFDKSLSSLHDMKDTYEEEFHKAAKKLKVDFS